MIKVGDVVKARECSEEKAACECFFCYHKSNRIGLVVADERTHADEEEYRCGWQVLFDFGEWEIFPSDLRDGNVEVISEVA